MREEGQPPRERGRDVAEAGERVSMLLTAKGWTFNVRLGRSGREEGEGIILIGDLGWRPNTGERRSHPARAMIMKADGRKRLELTLPPEEIVLTIPLEQFALTRLQERLKDFVSSHGMLVRIGFQASPMAEKQALEAVDFAFSTGARTENDRRAAAERERSEPDEARRTLATQAS